MLSQGMACPVCAYNVKRSLERVAGVAKVQVSMEERTAFIVYDDATTDVNAFMAARARAGFRSNPKL